MTHEQKDLGKMTRLMVFYVLQIMLYGYLFKQFMWERTFFHEIIMFEIGSMLFYLALNGFKYAVNYIEFVTLSNFSDWKNRMFLFSDLIIHLSKIVFQLVCLIRFTVFYNYPVFWARDIFMSVMISFEYVRKYVQSLKIVRGIDKLKTVSMEDRQEDCGICLQRMKNGTQLPCSHCFHRECLV